ncbi:MAG TPA: hypothetical protein VFX76_22735, partial [Roseiflexaceae bacterium]|nr:hypothetical protein [Roseiflexaceae bacterium]
INVLLETPPSSPIHRAATKHLTTIRSILATQARAAHLSEPEKFAQVWHFLMKGCIVSANEGNCEAAKQAREAAAVLLTHWQRVD